MLHLSRDFAPSIDVDVVTEQNYLDQIQENIARGLTRAEDISGAPL